VHMLSPQITPHSSLHVWGGVGEGAEERARWFEVFEGVSISDRMEARLVNEGECTRCLAVEQSHQTKHIRHERLEACPAAETASGKWSPSSDQRPMLVSVLVAYPSFLRATSSQPSPR